MSDTTRPREVTAADFHAVDSGSFQGDDTVWNHLTMRVPGSDHDFFLNKFGLLYNEVTALNLIKVDADGTVLEGPADVNTAGFVIRSAIHNDFHFPLGANEWPALLRLCDQLDPGYRS